MEEGELSMLREVRRILGRDQLTLKVFNTFQWLVTVDVSPADSLDYGLMSCNGRSRRS